MKPRPDHVPYLDRALSAAQRRQLRQWLLEDVTYAAAIVRLKELFGVDVSMRQLCIFWQRHCEPRRKETTRCGRPVLLDLRVFKKDGGWQFLLVSRTRGVRVTVNGRKLRPREKLSLKT